MGMVWAANPGDKFQQFKQEALAIGAALKAANGTSTSTASSDEVTVTVTGTVTVEAPYYTTEFRPIPFQSIPTHR